MRVNIVLPILSRRPIGGIRVALEYADFLAQRGHQVVVTHARRDSRLPGSAWLRLTDIAWVVKVRLFERPLIPWHTSHPGVRHRLVGSLAHLRVPDGGAVVATAWQTAEAVATLPASKGRKFYLIQHYEIWTGGKAEVDATWRLPITKIVIAKWLAEIGRSLGESDIVHIPNGMDVEHFRVTRPLDERPMQIVSLYHKEPFKGVPDVLAALREFHELRPTVRVAMFGVIRRGPEIPSWIEYFENPNQRSLVEDIYNGSSVYVGGSLEEGWGLTAAEAMACGCAFVGTDIGGFREFATPDGNALLSPASDPHALAANLVRLSDDPALRLRLQRRAAADMTAFTLERAGLRFEAVLQGRQ